MRLPSPRFVLAIALLLPAVPASASLLPVDPPTGPFAKLFEFEVKVKAPEIRDGRVRKGGEMEGKAKWEVKDPITGRETKVERKLKVENLASVPATLNSSYSPSRQGRAAACVSASGSRTERLRRSS